LDGFLEAAAKLAEAVTPLEEKEGKAPEEDKKR